MIAIWNEAIADEIAKALARDDKEWVIFLRSMML